MINKTDYLHGVDVSNHQPSWQPEIGDNFVFIKATEGQSYKDPFKKLHEDKARAAGMVVGFYHFLWPKEQSGTPEVQAAFFLNYAAPKAGDLLVCDWEYVGGAKTTPKEEDKDRFIAELKRLRPDLKIGLYVNRSMWNSSNKNKGDFLWLAEYAENPTVDGWTFWQYTSNPIDQNIALFKNKTELKNWITPVIPEEDVEVKLTDDDIARIASAVAKSVWDTDDIISSNKAEKNLDNKFWKAKSYLPKIVNLLVEIKAQLTAIERQTRKL